MLIDQDLIDGFIDVDLSDKPFILQELSNNVSEIYLLAFVDDFVDN